MAGLNTSQVWGCLLQECPSRGVTEGSSVRGGKREKLRLEFSLEGRNCRCSQWCMNQHICRPTWQVKSWPGTSLKGWSQGRQRVLKQQLHGCGQLEIWWFPKQNGDEFVSYKYRRIEIKEQMVRWHKGIVSGTLRGHCGHTTAFKANAKLMRGASTEWDDPKQCAHPSILTKSTKGLRLWWTWHHW